MGPRITSNIPTSEFTNQEILNFISELKIRKSSGHDKITPKILKWLGPTIAPLLCQIFNTFFSLGLYPKSCKIAKVIPLFKSGDNTNCENYRPISVLTQINKIFEKLVHDRLNNFITENNLLTNYQFGFRKGHSTTHGITHLIEKIVDQLEKKRVCAALFIDLKSAFDTIDSSTLLKKLDHPGIRGKLAKCSTIIPP